METPLRTLLVISISEWGSKKERPRRGNTFSQIMQNARLLLFGIINLMSVPR